MLISVVMPIYNAAACLPLVLPALAAQSCRDAEYVLVDNNSTDETPELLRRFAAERPELPVRLILETRQGRSAARNRGIAEARGQWLVFTDSDCVPDPEWLAELAVEMAAAPPEIGAIAGNILPWPAPAAIPKFLGLFTLQPTVGERVHQRFDLVSGGFPTANLAVRRQLAVDVGGFDQAVGHGEDYDFCIRLYAAGSRIKAVARAAVRHIHRATLRQFWLQSYDYGYGHALALSRLPEPVLVFAAPGIRLLRHGGCRRGWVDLNQADKKLLACLLAGLAWTPLWLLLPAYLCLLVLKVLRVARQKELAVGFSEYPGMISLLLVKSLALGCGRLAGSWRYMVLCI